MLIILLIDQKGGGEDKLSLDIFVQELTSYTPFGFMAAPNSISPILPNKGQSNKIFTHVKQKCIPLNVSFTSIIKLWSEFFSNLTPNFCSYSWDPDTEHLNFRNIQIVH